MYQLADEGLVRVYLVRAASLPTTRRVVGNVLGYIRVFSNEMPASVAQNLFPKISLFQIEECHYPEAVFETGNVGFIGGNI